MSNDLSLPARGDERAEHAGGRRDLGDEQDLGEAAVHRVERRARVEPEPAQPQDQYAEPEQRHVVPGNRPRLAVPAVLAAPRPEVQQHRERAGGSDQVHRGRAGEILHAKVGLQPAAAEHPVGGDRVDEPGEDDRIDDVDAELDPLERRPPHDGERHRAEHELEEPLRLDRRVGQPHHGERLQRVAVVAQEEPVMADDVADAEGEGEADRPVHDRRDREVGEDLRDSRCLRSCRGRSRSPGRRSPACMNITKQPAMITHSELIATESGRTPFWAASRVSADATAGTANAATIPNRDPRASHERRKTTTSSVVRERG